MSLATAVGSMAKKAGGKQPERKREDVLTRIHPDAIKEAKLAAGFRDMSLVEYLSTVVREAAARDIDEGIARRKQK